MADRVRVWLVLVGLLAAACGDSARTDVSMEASSPADQTSPADADAAVDGGVLEAFVEEVEVHGLDDVAVQPLPAGTIGPGEPLRIFVRFDAETDISIRDLVFAGTVATREDSTAELGVTGVCGYGWQTDGTRVTEDPCMAATPTVSVSPGMLVGLTLHPVTEEGVAGPGLYEAAVVLDEELGSRLELAVRLVRPGERPLPSWAEETIDLRVSLEEVGADTVERLRVAVVDGYGRVLDETAAADHAGGSYVVAVPVDVPWRLQPRIDSDDGPRGCGGGQTVVYARDDQPRTVTLLADNCAPDR